MLLVILIVVWAVVLPAVVVGGLLLASAILGRRTRRTGAVDVTGFADEVARLSATTPAAEQTEERIEAPRKPVGAAY